MHSTTSVLTSREDSIVAGHFNRHPRIRWRLLDAAPWALSLLGGASGVLFGIFHLKLPDAASSLWFAQNKGWALSAFGAFGTMSGFALAALALVASLSSHPRAGEVIDGKSGRFLVQCLLQSTRAWLVPAVISLSSIVLDSVAVEAMFIATATYSVAIGAKALLALTLFFRRFSTPLEE